jgi:hypothetical protein
LEWFSFIVSRKKIVGCFIWRLQKKIINQEDNEMCSIRGYIMGVQSKMFSEEIVVRKLKNRNNPDIIELRKKLNTVTKYKAIKKSYQTISKWFGLIFNGREQFWEAIAMDCEYDELDNYEIRFEELFDKFIKGKRFTWWETDSRRARKERMRYFESNLFVNRLSKELDHSKNNSCIFLRSPKAADISFQYRTRNRLMDYIWNNIGWIDDDGEFYELLIYTMYTISGLSGTARSRYSEEQLRKKYENSFKPPKNAQLDDNLPFNIRFFSMFLAMYETHLKKFDILKYESYEKTEKNYGSNKKKQERWKSKRKNIDILN